MLEEMGVAGGVRTAGLGSLACAASDYEEMSGRDGESLLINNEFWSVSCSHVALGCDSIRY